MDTDLPRMAADPATPLEVLADLAYRHPELRAAVAGNPSTYPDLLEWLRHVGDPDVDDALSKRMDSLRLVEARRRPGTPWVPWLVAGVAGAFALGLVAALLWPRPPQSPPAEEPLASVTLPVETPEPTPVPPPRDGSYPGASTNTLAQLPIVSQTVTADYGPEPAVQRFADDIVAGNVDVLIGNCWTFAPATVRDRYGTTQARGAILDAFSHPGRHHQGGAAWEGSEVTVNVRTEELRSAYACPDVTIQGEPYELNYVDAEYIVARLYGRFHGTPVRSSDTEINYPLICDSYWDLTGGPATQPPAENDLSGVEAAVEVLSGHDLTLRLVSGGSGDAYYELTRLDGSSPAYLIARLFNARTCIGDGSTS